jgi:alkyldihydroxyacetonephosphate synthase
MEACQAILQGGATPAVLRLYDQVESKRNFDRETNLLIILDEASGPEVDATMSVLREVLETATSEDVGLVDRWLTHRNDVGQLAPLWERHVVVDTIEMAGPWSALPAARAAVLAALTEVPGTLVASVHQSHSYLDGACLYFTFAGRPGAEEPSLEDQEAYYRAAWDAASEAIIAAGCALSHHHGIGRHRARYLPAALGDAFGVLSAIKTALDPSGIMNPGVLGLGQTDLP